MTVEIITGGDAPALGRKVEGGLHRLDVFMLPTSVDRVSYTSDEVTAVCPITSQPDWYTVTITLQGSKFGIESKSLKLYLQSYRNEGLFCEAFADSISRDVMDATGASHVAVSVQQKPRGGITIEAHSIVWQSMATGSRCDDGESSTVQDIPIRGSTPTPESLGEVS